MGKIVKLFSYVISPLILSVFVYLYLSGPVYNGYITHNHQKYGVVYVRRDEHGIPTIKGKSLRDSLFGLGYAHCQDRQWSMDMSRRFASGRLSELFGNKTRDIDTTQREFGLYHLAKQIKLDEDIKEKLQAYTDGINECHANKRARQLEYLLTRSEFEEWKIEDSIVIQLQVYLTLAQDFPAELIRQKLSFGYGKQRAQRMTVNPYRGPIPEETIMSKEEVQQMNLYQYFNVSHYFHNQHSISDVNEKQIDKILESGISEFLDHQRGSNTWAIHGNHTVTGKPIVANDPHLQNQIPSFWYQTHLIYQTARNITVSGLSVPGIPCIVQGLTDYFAWGVTALSNDIADLYQEQLNDDKTKYLFEGKWRDLKIREEEIKIKGFDSFKFKVRATHHGPIIRSHEQEQTISLCWVNNIKKMVTFNGFYSLYEATNVDQVLKGFQMIEGHFGISFGTTDNHIGFYATGAMPIRNNPHDGLFIQNGTERKNDWTSFLPKDKNPHVVDPPKGFVVASNNKISPDSTIGFSSVNMPPTSRSLRIREMIEAFIKAGKKISVEDVKKMQQDNLDVYARIVTNPLLLTFDKHRDLMLNKQKKLPWESVLVHLRNWDYRFELDSIGATVFSTINYFIAKKMIYRYHYEEQKKNDAIFYYHMDIFLLSSIVNWSQDQELDGMWCDHTTCAGEQKSCLKLLFVAIEDSYNYLKKKLGDDMSKWQWKNIHQKKLPHLTFTQNEYLKKVFDNSYPVAGSRRTVNVNAENFKKDDFNSVFSANMRSVYSLDLNEKSYFIIDTGTSESILSSHYNDQMKLYQQDQYLEIKRDLNKLKENNVDMLLLVYDPKKETKSEFSNDKKQEQQNSTKKPDQDKKTDM